MESLASYVPIKPDAKHLQSQRIIPELLLDDSYSDDLFIDWYRYPNGVVIKYTNGFEVDVNQESTGDSYELYEVEDNAGLEFDDFNVK